MIDVIESEILYWIECSRLLKVVCNDHAKSMAAWRVASFLFGVLDTVGGEHTYRQTYPHQDWTRMELPSWLE